MNRMEKFGPNQRLETCVEIAEKQRRNLLNIEKYQHIRTDCDSAMKIQIDFGRTKWTEKTKNFIQESVMKRENFGRKKILKNTETNLEFV